MFACLYSLSAPVAALVAIAEDFTPRFEVVGPLVMLDVSGLSRLLGSPREIGEQLRKASPERTQGASRWSGPVRIGLAPTQTAAALLALGRAGLTVVMPGERDVLASLPVTLLSDFDRLRLVPHVARDAAQYVARDFSPAMTPAIPPAKTPIPPAVRPPHVGEMVDVLPYFHSTLDRASDAARAAHACGGGWKHPRDSHLASRFGVRSAKLGGGAESSALAEIQSLLDTLRRWGIKTFGAFTALPAGDVYERLGARGVLWHRLARGEDTSPLVPWVPEDPFEGSLDLEWPIEGLEPLSFVLSRLLEPLAERLERADRGVAVLHTHLRLVSKDVHARTLQLPAPMRDPKTLRTLMLLDLESNPPSAAIDRVRVLIEPTPARVTQWMLFERAQPSPEQVSTLLARLTALMGETHVGSPRLVDSWKPGIFEMTHFKIPHAQARPLAEAASGGGGRHPAPSSALRRFRLPVPARVRVQDGRPVRVMTDRRGVTGGAVEQAAGPWRTSGEWWNDGQVGQVGQVGQIGQVGQVRQVGRIGQVGQVRQVGRNSHLPHSPHPPYSSCWDRDEWDVAIADGTVYRVFVERDVGQWFIEGVVD